MDDWEANIKMQLAIGRCQCWEKNDRGSERNKIGFHSPDS